MRRLIALVLLLFVTTPAFSATTAAEYAANAAAQHELDTSAPDGNLPSYSLSQADLARGAHLEHIRNILHFGNAIWGILQLVLLLGLGVIYRFQAAVASRFRNRWLQGFGFLLLFLITTELLGLPVDIYAQWLRRSYGISIQSWSGWATDQAKEFALMWLIGGLLVMLLFWIIRRFPNRWWLVFSLAMIPISIGGVFLTPYVIDPLFNKFEPLNQSHPELVRRLEEVAKRGNMDIPPERMFLMKASEKLTVLNAYVTGFGSSKRVVVWDTSIAKGTPDEILFIFGHESGHYVLHHIVRGIVLSIAGMFVLLYVSFVFVRWSVRRFSGWGIASQAEWGALPVLLLALSLMNFVFEPVGSTISRMQEHEADVYGQEAIHGLVTDPQVTARGAFQVLGETSYDDPNPSQLIEFWTYSHPSIGRRAAFAAHYNPWATGVEPKYFPKQ